MSYLFVALTFGLAWALRGHFGHEHGAAWAGGLAALAMLVVARRSDLALRAPIVASLAGLGWGVGGMMSYGLIVGYGRASDFPNVFYGLCMLAVVGALYGFIGGGFLGLGLESTGESPVEWPSLLTQMVAGGLLFWWVLVAQFGWLMTPPRSELWAACLGASLALGWYLQRHNLNRSFHLACYSALGTGFGFAFGNFLQTAGTASGVDFNWWNVMEFSLGFFGGLAMAYGVLSSEWPQAPPPAKRKAQAAIFLLFLAIPATNVIQAFTRARLERQAEQLGLAAESLIDPMRIQAWSLLVLAFVSSLWLWRWVTRGDADSVRRLPWLFFSYLLTFQLLSHIRKAVVFSGFRGQPEHLAYIVTFVMLLALWAILKGKARPTATHAEPSTPKAWFIVFLGTIAILALLAVVSISIHEGLPGARQRF